MINVAVCGANGKMGQEVVKAVNSAEDMALVAQIDIFNGQFTSIKDAKDAVKIDVLIDFTQPASIYENALYCLNNGGIASNIVSKVSKAFVTTELKIEEIILLELSRNLLAISLGLSNSFTTFE
jgi:hypothetical protein